MRIENRQQALAIVAVVAVTLLVGDKLVVTPLVSRWKERGARISELTKAVSQGSLVLAREQAIRNRWDNMRTNTLPENVSAAENELLKAFERWSQASRISIANVLTGGTKLITVLNVELGSLEIGAASIIGRTSTRMTGIIND